MTMVKAAAFGAAMLACAAAPAAAESVKIGFMATLSGPPAALGEHMRDGFMLALQEREGRLGGLDAQVVVVDDELKPEVAVSRVQGLIERDQVDMVVGVVFSNVMMAIHRPLVEADKIFISGNAGPSPIAGAQCSENFFAVSWQNDANHEVMGKYAHDQGWERVFIMAPNYQAGRDGLAGFKRYYEGEPVDEIYTQLDQLDFSAELARIAAAQPDAVYAFMPGGMGVNLVRQYRQAGLAETIPFLSAFTVDETTLPATGEAALGMFAGAQWAPDIDTEANRAFVEAFEAEFDYAPSLYAAQGYDLARLIDGALEANGGAVETASLREAIRGLEFDSIAGDFAFNRNGFPIRDYYMVEAVQREDGKVVTQTVEKVFERHEDAYVGECPLE